MQMNRKDIYHPLCFHGRIASLLRTFACAFAAIAIGAGAARAENAVTKRLLAMPEGERNTVWTSLLRDSVTKCDFVVKSAFQGSARDQDEWNVLCANKADYSISVPDDSLGRIKSTSCAELRATDLVLAKRAGQKVPSSDPCWRNQK
jgi:hypothetical protein